MTGMELKCPLGVTVEPLGNLDIEFRVPPEAQADTVVWWAHAEGT